MDFLPRKKTIQDPFVDNFPAIDDVKCFTLILTINFMPINKEDYTKIVNDLKCHNPTLGKCEDETHTPKSGNLESSGIPENSELDCKGQNTSHWGVLYNIGKVLKCRCPKWPRMSHLDICSTSCGRKKSQESNWQFDSRPLKVGNRLNPGVCR